MSLFLSCAAGVEPWLAAEVRGIVGPDLGVQERRGGVELPADATAAMRLNLESRLAMRVLWRVAEGPYRDENDLYALARSVRWIDWVAPTQTLRVDTSAQRSPLRSLNFVQAGNRTRVVFNLNAPQTFDTRVEGKDVLVTLADSGPTGLLQAREMKPDVITLDIAMPGMD